jgi:hypothetical protein
MKKCALVLTAVCIQLHAASYIPFEFLNKLKVPVVFMVGTKRQVQQMGFADRPKEVAPGKASKDITEIDNDQPMLRLYLKDNPGVQYTFEFNTEGKKQIKIRLVEDHGIIRLEPQTQGFGIISIGGNVKQEDIIRITPSTTSPQPIKKPVQDKQPIPGARPPQRPSLLIEAIMRGDSLNDIKKLFASNKVSGLNEKDDQGNTALYYAEDFAEFGRQDDDQKIVAFLKSKGAR